MTRLLLAAAAAIALWQPFGPVAHRITDRITALEAEEEYLWVGAETGEVARYDLRTDRWESLGHPPDLDGAVLDIEADSRYVWFGATDGAARWDRRRETWDRDFDTAEIRGPTIRRILAGERWIWFAAARVAYPSSALPRESAGGLTRIDQWTGRSRTWTAADGLPSDDVFDLAEVDGKIWVATAGGLASIEPLTEALVAHGPPRGAQDDRAFALATAAPAADGFWVGSAGDLHRVSAGGEVETVIIGEGAEAEIRRVLAVGDRVLVATRGAGLLVGDPTAGLWARVPEAIVARDVTDVAAEGRAAWIASAPVPSSSRLFRWLPAPPEGAAGREPVEPGALGGPLWIPAQGEGTLLARLARAEEDALGRWSAFVLSVGSGTAEIEGDSGPEPTWARLARLETREVRAAETGSLRLVLAADGALEVSAEDGPSLEVCGLETVENDSTREEREILWRLERVRIGVDGRAQAR